MATLGDSQPSMKTCSVQGFEYEVLPTLDGIGATVDTLGSGQVFIIYIKYKLMGGYFFLFSNFGKPVYDIITTSYLENAKESKICKLM